MGIYCCFAPKGPPILENFTWKEGMADKRFLFVCLYKSAVGGPDAIKQC